MEMLIESSNIRKLFIISLIMTLSQELILLIIINTMAITAVQQMGRQAYHAQGIRNV